MSDKLGILINTILNVKQEDLQKQLNSVSNKIRINLKPRIDFDENVIAKFKNDVDKLARNIKLNLRFEINQQTVRDAEKAVSDTAKKISEKTQNTKIKVFDIEKLEAEGRQFFISATGIVNRVKNQFKDLGDVNVNFLKNAKNQVVGFEAEIKKLDGTIEKLRFDMAKIKVGDSTQKGFVFSGANLIDKNAGDVLQKNLNTLQKFETRLKNIRDSFTSSRGVKDVTNLNILNKEYNSILSTIEKLRKSQSNLTEEQKRNIDKQINTLRSLYKAYRDIEITAEKGFNFKQYQEVSDGFNKIKTAQDGFNISLLQNHKLVKASVQETEQYLKINQELQKGNWIKDVGVYVDKATGKMYQFQNAQRNIMVDTLTWSKAIITALKRIAQWAVSGTLIFGTLRQIKESITYIKDVDTELTNLSKVVDLTTSQIIEMKNAAIEMSKTLGQSSVEVLKGFAESGRYTKDLSEIQELTRTAIMASNVTDMSVTEASKSLISALTQFKLSAKDSINVLDQWNEIQNNFKVAAKDMAEGISKVGSIAYQAKVPIQDLNGYITALVQSMQISGDEAGTALKSMISRIYRIGEEGAEDAGKTEEFLNKLGIAVRKSKDEFLPFNEILLQIKNRWSELTQAERIALEQQIGGTWHYAKVAALIENMNVAIDASTKAYNSQGSAIKENQKYLDSIAGRYQIFRDTLESIYNSFWSSDLFKNVLSGATEFLNIIDRVIKQLGGLQTVLLLVATIGISKFLTSMFAIAKGAGVLETALVAVQLGIKGISTALLGLLTNPVTWLIAAIGAITVGIMTWANHQQKLKEQIEATNKAQSDFNKIIDEFNKTLDIQKINEAAQALEQLKQATNYNESVKQIQKLKEEIAQLESSNTTRSGREYTYGVNDGAIAIKKKQLTELEEKIKSVTEAEKKYNEVQQLARALDYQSVQDSSRKIALKIREIESNKRLFDSYEKVYKKLSEGKSLTEDEIELNNKLINDYPEYTRVLNQKTGALGVNIEALKSNLKAQEALAIIELNSLKETAKAEKLKTQGLIEETDKRIRAIDGEIKTLEARNQAYAALINADDPNALRYEKFYLNNYNRIKEAGKLLAESKKQLETLRTTVNAWDTLENLSIDDLRKSVTSTSGFFLEDKDKDKSESTEIYEAEINQFQQLEDALAKVNDEIERNQALTDIAEDKDKINLLSKRIDLYKQEQEILHQLAEARRNVIQQNVEKLQGLGFDISYDRNANELLIRNIERLNQLKGKDAEATNELRKSTEELIQTTQSLNDANRQASTQYIQLNKDIKDLKQQQEEYAQKLIESYQNYVVKKIEEEIDAWEDAKKKAQEAAQEKIDAIQSEIDRLQERNEQLKIEEERQERLIEIAKQKEILENVKKQKNVRIYQNGQWVWVADPNKVKEETDKLKDLQDDYAKWEAENARQAEIQRLQNQIKQIQTDLKTTENYYDNKIKLGQEFLEKYKKQWEEEKEEVTSYEALIQGLSGIEQSVYKTRLQQLNDFVTAWNALVSSMMTPSAVGGSVNVKVSSSTTSSDGSYADGGVVDYTGLATVHGSPNAVETVFNAEQGKKLYDFVKNLPNNMNFLNVRLPQLNIPLFKNNATSQTTENHYHFENLNIQANDPSEMFRKLNMLIEQYT